MMSELGFTCEVDYLRGYEREFVTSRGFSFLSDGLKNDLFYVLTVLISTILN